jgi:ribonuclease HII
MTAKTNDLLAFERPLIARGEIVVGLDEVGRGALAGPLTVGAVVITEIVDPPSELTDSKLLTANRREALQEPIKLWASAWSLGSVSSQEIDEWGLRLALAVAATRAVQGLDVVPTYALIDGSFNLLDAPADVKFGSSPPPELVFSKIPHTTIVKGDQKSATIAGASVLAKVSRDAFMTELSEEFPAYGWSGNKGYGAAGHLNALSEFGATVYHRRSWNLPVFQGQK